MQLLYRLKEKGYDTTDVSLGGFLIGMTDILVEGEWVWMSTKTTAQYTNW